MSVSQEKAERAESVISVSFSRKSGKGRKEETLLCADTPEESGEEGRHCSAQTHRRRARKREDTALRRHTGGERERGTALLCADTVPGMQGGYPGRISHPGIPPCRPVSLPHITLGTSVRQPGSSRTSRTHAQSRKHALTRPVAEQRVTVTGVTVCPCCYFPSLMSRLPLARGSS